MHPKEDRKMRGMTLCFLPIMFIKWEPTVLKEIDRRFDAQGAAIKWE